MFVTKATKIWRDVVHNRGRAFRSKNSKEVAIKVLGKRVPLTAPIRKGLSWTKGKMLNGTAAVTSKFSKSKPTARVITMPNGSISLGFNNRNSKDENNKNVRKILAMYNTPNNIKKPYREPLAKVIKWTERHGNYYKFKDSVSAKRFVLSKYNLKKLKRDYPEYQIPTVKNTMEDINKWERTKAMTLNRYRLVKIVHDVEGKFKDLIKKNKIFAKYNMELMRKANQPRVFTIPDMRNTLKNVEKWEKTHKQWLIAFTKRN